MYYNQYNFGFKNNQAEELQAKSKEKMLVIPHIVDASVPVGKDDF